VQVTNPFTTPMLTRPYKNRLFIRSSWDNERTNAVYTGLVAVLQVSGTSN